MEIACDAALKNRRYDADGRLHIMRTPISKATVNPYYGREIPGATELGLEPERVYYMLRDPGELAKAAQSFARVQLMFVHTAVSADDPKQDSIAGTVGSDVEFEAPYLMADLCVWDAEAIAGIETETVQELSSSYRYRADMTPGMYEGQRHDGVMRDIQGNHVALVKAGRAGSDVKAADAAFNESDHPRSENGEFSNGENGGHVEKKAEPRWQADYLLIENKGPGLPVAQEIVRLMGSRQWVTRLVDPEGVDKLARLQRTEPLFENGFIYAPDTEWAQMVIDEVSAFPRSRHDDLTDTVSQVVNFLRRFGDALLQHEHDEIEDDALLFRPEPKPLYDV